MLFKTVLTTASRYKFMSMTIKQQILQSSYYAHLKAADELSKVLMTDRAEEVLKEANKISVELNKQPKNGR
jgi:hypothetical protein